MKLNKWSIIVLILLLLIIIIFINEGIKLKNNPMKSSKVEFSQKTAQTSIIPDNKDMVSSNFEETKLEDTTRYKVEALKLKDKMEYLFLIMKNNLLRY